MVDINKKLMWDFVSQNKSLYILFIVAAIIAFPIQFSIMPQKLTKLISELTKSGKIISKKDNIFSNIFSNITRENIMGLIVIIVLLWIVILICTVLQDTARLNLIPMHLQYIRTQMFESLVNRHKDNYKDVPTAEYITRIVEVSRVYTQTSEYIVAKYIPYGIGIIVVSAYAFSIDPSLGSITLASLLAISINCVLWGREIEKQSAIRESSYVNMMKQIISNRNRN